MSETEQPNKSRSRFMKRVGITIMVFLIALFSLSLIVHIPAVQSWGVRQITRYLSKETGSEVRVNAFSLNILSQLTLEDVYISQYQQPGDTLIYAEELGLKFTRLWKLFGKEPEIKQLRLRSAEMHIGDAPIRLFTTGQNKRNNPGLRIQNPEILLDDVRVVVNQDRQPLLMEYYLPGGVIRIDKIDTELKELVLETIYLQNPSVHLQFRQLVLTDTTNVNVFEAIDTATTPPFAWNLRLGTMTVDDGVFSYEGGEDQSEADIVNYQDLRIEGIKAQLSDLFFADSVLAGIIEGVSFREKSGFTIEEISAGHFSVSPDGLAFGQLRLATPESVVSDTLHIDFGDPLSDEPAGDKLQLYARFENARIAIADLLKTIPGLQNSEVFGQNSNEVLHISGIVRGSPNRMRGDSLRVLLGNMTFDGQFRSRNLATPGKQVLNLVVNQARFTPFDLERHIPGVRIQDQFSRLGQVQFQGRFDGFLDDFVAYGKVRTDIGSAEVDINLETTQDQTLYSGRLSLINFNLQKWTGLPDFGMVSTRLELKNGSGLSAETASADIVGTIGHFDFRGYRYSDIQVNGHLDKDQFDGQLAIDDPNIGLQFEGAVRAIRDIPVFDFTAVVNHLDLRKLNLSKDTFSISGVITAQGSGKDFSTLTGQVRATGVEINQGKAMTYALDTVYLGVEKRDSGERLVTTNSDYAKGWIQGDFELQSVYPSIAHYLEETYPEYFSGLKYKPELSDAQPAMTFSLVLNKPEEWGGLLNVGDLRFHDLSVHGTLNLARDSVIINASAPDVHFRNVNIYRPELHFASLDGQAVAEIGIVAVDIEERYFFDEISASVRTSDDGFVWSLAADDLFEELNTLDLSGRFIIDTNNTYTLKLDPEIIEIVEQTWGLREGNVIRWGSDFIELRDIVFENGEQMIAITDVDRRGVVIETREFDFSFIDALWDYDKLDFEGPYTLRAGVADIFTMDDFYLLIDAPELLINEDSYGAFHVDAKMPEAGDPVSFTASLENQGVHLSAAGAFYPAMEEVKPDLQNTMDINIDIDTFPIAFLEYFLKGSIESTVGLFVGKLRIHGSLDNTKMDGNAVIYDCATTVSYLGTRYRINGQKVRITESVIDASGSILTDAYGNAARVQGGLTHSAFAKLGLNARITSSRILSLNTTREDNPTYYGQGIGSIDARFQGPADRPAISVNAVTSEGTSIVINLVDAGETSNKSFLRFRGDDEVISGSLNNRTNITGLNFEMNMTATPEAVVEIKLEDNPPESIVGSGNGNIQMSISRTGDFSMYGEYQIERGDYLFRSFVIINKPFVLRRGGTIRWTGDPYNALINIEADYSGLRASLSTLLAEYLVNASEDAQEEARRKHDVQLKLLLTGTLLEPEINFDLSFPNLSGELAGYADTKLRVLKSNQNAMNEQVFGLLWAGSFLPSNVLQTNSSLTLAQEGITNSITEFLSGQVSALFSSVISRWVEDVDLISGIDFDVGYSRGSQFDYTDVEGSTQDYEEWEVRVKPRLLNDRVIIDAGGNYVTSSIDAGRYFVGDYALEYLLTRDGRLKVRFYYRQDPPTTIQGRRDKFGIGLAWRREFDTFEEWLGGLKKNARDLREGETQ